MCPSTALFFFVCPECYPLVGRSFSSCAAGHVSAGCRNCARCAAVQPFRSPQSHARLPAKHTVVCGPFTRSPHDLIGERVVHAYTAVCRATEFSCACVEVFVSICAGLRVLCFGFRGRFLVMFFEMQRICGAFAVCCG